MCEKRSAKAEHIAREPTETEKEDVILDAFYFKSPKNTVS